MHKGEDLDCKVLSVIMRHLNISIIFLWNRISLDLNYSRLAGSSLTMIIEILLTLKVKEVEIFIRLCNTTPR